MPPVKDLTYWFSDLSFFDPEAKNVLWCSQSLFFCKLNSKVFLDPHLCKEYRKLDRLELDEKVYKQMIDPPTPMDNGGTAEYFASDWMANPINIHLENQLRARVEKIGIENKIQVNEIDKYAKGQKQKDKDQIIFQREFRALINNAQQMLGLPPIKDSQTPYGYVQSLNKDNQDKAVGSVDSLIDYIKSQIKDSQDITLYETYVYKGDIERAFELGIQHYVINMNKWKVKQQPFYNDIKNFNKACGRWYIDETTGRGNIEYLEPDRLYVSPFKQNNGEDIMHWYYEYPITFAEFVRQFGTTLTDEQLKEVFELNKYQGSKHGMSWSSAKGFKGSNANIMIGVCSVLTQDAEKFAVEYSNGRVKSMKRAKLSWLPKETEEQRQTIYNTWYSFYYVPPPGDKTSRNQMADWAWQSQYIFNIHKDIDMYRYGVDMRYAKSTLVIWQDPRPSFMDLEQAYMPKIHTAWHKFQNCLIQDVTGVVFDYDLLGAMLNAVDEGNKTNPGDPKNPSGGNGPDAAMEMWKMLRQGGMAWMKFRDKNGNMVIQDPSKLFVNINTGHLDKGEKYLKIIFDLYNQMTITLAQNDITEGQDPKPRTPVAGIQASVSAAKDGIWFIEFACREFLIMFGERCVQHIITMVKERKKYGFRERWDEFQSVVGRANALMIEGLEDTNPEEIGMTVSLEDVRSKQEYYTQLTTQMLRDGKIDDGDVEMILSAIEQNYKYGACLLNISAKKIKAEMAHKEELDFERQMQLEDKRLQTAMALNKSKADGKNSNIQTQAKVDAMVNDALNKGKANTMAAQKEQLLNNKLRQQDHQHELNQAEKVQDALAPTNA